MRVKVRFRYNSVTGEVETFDVADMHDGPRLADHDARHDRATADIARVVEANALIEEVAPGTEPLAAAPAMAPAETEQPSRAAERGRQ
jgi:FtsH ternary system domain X3